MLYDVIIRSSDAGQASRQEVIHERGVRIKDDDGAVGAGNVLPGDLRQDRRLALARFPIHQEMAIEAGRVQAEGASVVGAPQRQRR